jgi:tRNA G18 (ribose-2'-O)-methylase SpoU
MDAVLLSPTCCDPLYRRAVRVSMGEVFALPYAYLDPFPVGIAQVRDAGFRVLAMTPGGTDLGTVEITGRTALLLGAEGPGLTSEAMAASDLRVGLPMAHGVDSLNIAAAAAVGCWVVGRRPGAR